VLASFMWGSYLLVVVVVFSFEMVVPSGRVTLPLTVLEVVELDESDAGGVVTTVVDEDGGVGAGVTTVVFLSTVVAAGVVEVVVVEVFSQAASEAAPATRMARGISFFMAIAPVIVDIPD